MGDENCWLSPIFTWPNLPGSGQGSPFNTDLMGAEAKDAVSELAIGLCCRSNLYLGTSLRGNNWWPEVKSKARWPVAKTTAVGPVNWLLLFPAINGLAKTMALLLTI